MNQPSYPEQINLPFNFSLIREAFEFRSWNSEPPVGPGIWIILQGNGVVLLHDDDGASLPNKELPEWCSAKLKPLWIGSWHGAPVRVVTIGSDIMVPAPHAVSLFNAQEQELEPALLTLAGLGKQILHWQRQSGYCSRCGAATEAISGSWGKRCGSCRAEHFPHIHPCAIVLVKRGNELLLTRKAEWAPGRFGLVAGFVEFGESLEECAIREVKEETGIHICNVRYLGSQNWPFPAQLMAGFVADYAGGEISIDTNELEDAGWFPIDRLPTLPPHRSIARWIIDNCKMTNQNPI